MMDRGVDEGQVRIMDRTILAVAAVVLRVAEERELGQAVTVYTLVTARQRTAAANLEHVIEEARSILGLGPDLDFEAMVWPLPRDRGGFRQ